MAGVCLRFIIDYCGHHLMRRTFNSKCSIKKNTFQSFGMWSIGAALGRWSNLCTWCRHWKTIDFSIKIANQLNLNNQNRSFLISWNELRILNLDQYHYYQPKNVMIVSKNIRFNRGNRVGIYTDSLDYINIIKKTCIQMYAK